MSNESNDIFIERKKKNREVKKRGKKSKTAAVKNSFTDSDKPIGNVPVLLEDNLEKFAEELKIADNKTTKPTGPTNNADENLESKRNELIKAAEEGYIDKKSRVY